MRWCDTIGNRFLEESIETQPSAVDKQDRKTAVGTTVI
jgi:hypothetical protein